MKILSTCYLQVKKVRKAKPLKADDLLRAAVKQESNDDTAHHSSRRGPGSRNIKSEPAVEDEPDLDTDDLPGNCRVLFRINMTRGKD